MGSSETGPKEFERAEELLPITSPGVSTLQEFELHQRDVQRIAQLKGCGLTDDEIQLYRDKEEGMERFKMENRVLREKLQYIYSKLEAARENERSCETKDQEEDAMPSTSGSEPRFSQFSPTFYPENHPMNNIKQLEKDMFDHIKVEKIAPINKRRKILRRLHRKQEALQYDLSKIGVKEVVTNLNKNPNSLWDVRKVPKRVPHILSNESVQRNANQNDEELNQRIDRNPKRMIGPIGPKTEAHYTIRDNKIVRLEPIANVKAQREQEYRAVDIVVPVNEAEERLLEGTKLSIDQIRSIERFKHYEPGRPSKVLYLKNISPAACSEDISILFNQFVHENQAPVRVRLMTGRLRGQAFVHFQHENVAIQALEDVNGTVVKGRPVIAQFGKNSNNLQADHR